MHKEILNTVLAPKAIGPYVQAILLNDMIYTSGQLGLNPSTGTLEEGIEAQTHRAMKNMEKY